MAPHAAIDELVVTLEHPVGTLNVPLRQWMRYGPGERPGLRPVAVYAQPTGQRLPLRTISLVYRNTWYARILIALGVLRSPWRN